jgi:predicted metal-dependent phosphoesterase TrpH
MHDLNFNSLYVDMHVHTNFSDGVFTPKEVIEYASKIGLAAIGITDHDSIDGINEALEIASRVGVEVIPGIELSSETIVDSKKSEVHILGYYVDYKSERFKKFLSIFKKARYDRAMEIFEKLRKNGIEFKNNEFVKNTENKIIGRLHFAKALVEEKFVNSVQEAFQKYLSCDKPAYVPKYSISTQDVIGLVLDAGGIPVMAHPYHYTHHDDKFMFETFIKYGLMGIEAWHTKHTESVVKKILTIAEKFNLLVTGGTDCHGPYKKTPPIMGNIRIPYSVLERLKNAKKYNNKI